MRDVKIYRLKNKDCIVKDKKIYYQKNKFNILKKYTKVRKTVKWKKYMKKYCQKPKRKEYMKKYLNNFENKNRAKGRHLKRTYNIDLIKFNQMRLAQNNSCAICGDPFKNDKHTHVDHNHITNKIRDLLCRDCNWALGHFKENINVMKKAIMYLKKHGGK